MYYMTILLKNKSQKKTLLQLFYYTITITLAVLITNTHFKLRVKNANKIIK